jgi:class 3 adenylate cyclase
MQKNIDLPSNMKHMYLAIVLLDIIGSTAFVQRYGAKKAALLFQYHDRLTRSLIYKNSGREIDRSDGFLCSFESVSDAIKFGLAYQEEIPFKTRLSCRIGIHWGEIIEVRQHDYYVTANAKKIELEGINKNIAARTMSICGSGQILLTKEAIDTIKSRVGGRIPKNTFYACVGLYKFKGVKSPQQIYAVGKESKDLQPPPSSSKVKRLGGPKYIKKKARNRNFIEWMKWTYHKLAWMVILFWCYFLTIILFNPYQRWILGLSSEVPFLDQIKLIFNNFIGW